MTGPTGQAAEFAGSPDVPSALFLSVLYFFIGEAVVLYQADWELRTPWPSNPDGYYYWTNVYYIEADDEADLISHAFAITQLTLDSHSPLVQNHRWQFRTPPGSEIIAGGYPLYDTVCRFGGVKSTRSVYSCVRINGYIGGRLVWYKRYRVCLAPDEIFQIYLTPSTFAYFASNIIPELEALPLRTRDGSPIERYAVSPVVVSWQLRDGTKRRERTVIAE